VPSHTRTTDAISNEPFPILRLILTGKNSSKFPFLMLVNGALIVFSAKVDKGTKQFRFRSAVKVQFEGLKYFDVATKFLAVKEIFKSSLNVFLLLALNFLNSFFSLAADTQRTSLVQLLVCHKLATENHLR
jgi:hypothetical protein